MPDYKLKERMNGIMKSLEKGIRDVFESGRYEAYLDTMSRFHRYSVNNTLLIYLQKPDATLVAGYRSWQERFGRNVKKGEKSILVAALRSGLRRILRAYTGSVGNCAGFVWQEGNTLSLYVFKIG